MKIRNITIVLVALVTSTLFGCFGEERVRHKRNSVYHAPRPQKKIITQSSPPAMPGTSGKSYKVVRKNGRVVRREGAVWGTVPSKKGGYRRVGLPKNPTPKNIRKKFKEDVRHLQNRRNSGRGRRSRRRR